MIKKITHNQIFLLKSKDHKIFDEKQKREKL